MICSMLFSLPFSQLNSDVKWNTTLSCVHLKVEHDIQLHLIWYQVSVFRQFNKYMHCKTPCIIVGISYAFIYIYQNSSILTFTSWIESHPSYIPQSTKILWSLCQQDFLFEKCVSTSCWGTGDPSSNELALVLILA